MKNNNFKIAVFAGDGIGQEIINEALKVLKIISGKKKTSTFKSQKDLSAERRMTVMERLCRRRV